MDLALQGYNFGNDGEKYWKWYGFNSRVEWCAIFVSRCANESGLLNISIPKFAGCQSEGVKWFKDNNLCQDKGYIPTSGDVIFFDWNGDGWSDHVGIVALVQNNSIYTIEGNSNNECKQQNYSINSKFIYGFGQLNK